MGRKQYEAAKKSAAKALDSLDRAYMGLVSDLRQRAEVLGEPRPETGDVGEQELRNRYPGLDGIAKHPGAMAATGRQEDPTSATFTEGEGPA